MAPLPALSGPRVAHEITVEVGAIQGLAVPPLMVVRGQGLSASVVWTVRPGVVAMRRQVLASHERARMSHWGLADEWSARCAAQLRGGAEAPGDALLALAGAWDLEVW